MKWIWTHGNLKGGKKEKNYRWKNKCKETTDANTDLQEESIKNWNEQNIRYRQTTKALSSRIKGWYFVLQEFMDKERIKLLN